MDNINLENMIEVDNNSNSSKFDIRLDEDILGKDFTLVAYTASPKIKSRIIITADGKKILSEEITSEPSTFVDLKIPSGADVRLSVESESHVTAHRHGKQAFGYAYQFANADAKGTFLSLLFKYKK